MRLQDNKTHTIKKMKESIFLAPSRLKFFRREDIRGIDRLDLAIVGLGKDYRTGPLSEYEARYKVSHTFIYNQTKILKASIGDLFGSVSSKEKGAAELEKVLRSIRFHLEGKLETKSPLYGLSNLGGSIGVPYNSTNFISQALEVAGSLISSSYSSDIPYYLVFLCDEVYSGGQAILVSLEAQSMLVLDIFLVEDNLTSSDWEGSFARLAGGQIVPKSVIKDQGSQMASAVEKLPEEVLIGADTFHAIPHRLGIFHSRLKRELDQAIQKEEERAIVFANTKSYETALKKEVLWEQAKQNTLAAKDELEWFDEYYFTLLQQLRPFTSQGIPRGIAKAEQIMKESIEALTLLEIPSMGKHLEHIEKLLDNGQLLHYMEQVPVLYQEIEQMVEQETLWLWMLFWQWNKKSYQSHSPKVQQRAKQETLAAQQLLKEHYQEGQANGQIKLFEKLQKSIFAKLDEIVQASSLVETFNSILKPFINAARGQVSQELLNLVKFYHNHRIFKRGKRQGHSPIELLTDVAPDKHWIDLLMDKIRNAFEQHQTCSLKQLHQIICSKSNDDALIVQLDLEGEQLEKAA